ncbi:hypothetical protein MY11210_008429 [Beauveria gryllotalpidicola]
MPDSLWSHAKARLKQAYNNTTLNQPKIAAMTTTTKTEDKALALHPRSYHPSSSPSPQSSHPGSQPPSYQASMQDLAQTDVILNRMFYNQLYSPLARLPDHILVNIMRSSDLESLSRLRHTSRIFMILFSVNPAFKSLHLTSDDDPRFHATARLWEVPRSIIPTHQEAFFLEPRRICQSCLKRRKGDRLGRTLLSSMPVLYCSGCRTTHREMHFSARMRNAIDDDRVQAYYDKSGDDEIQAFDPNVCDCVDYYQDLPSVQRQRPTRICPAPAIARWQETAPEGGYVSETGRCAYMRHGFTFEGVGIQLRVDFLKCHDATNEMLAMRKTLDCAVDPHSASSAGWGDLVSWLSFDTMDDKKKRGLFFCPRSDCATWRLTAYDVHLRAIEAKQMQRGKLVSTTIKMAKERQDSGDEDDNSGATMMAKQ